MNHKAILPALIILVMLATTRAMADLQCTHENTAAPATTAHLVDNGDGTVSDPQTGLMWKKCPEGQVWITDMKKCDGMVAEYTWQQALQRPPQVNAGAIGQNLGHTDWRLPNIKELASIVELRCWDPAINEAVFPAVPRWFFWSSSPVASDDGDAFQVDFHYGTGGWDGAFTFRGSSRDGGAGVRLVRGEQ